MFAPSKSKYILTFSLEATSLCALFLQAHFFAGGGSEYNLQVVLEFQQHETLIRMFSILFSHGKCVISNFHGQ